MHCWVRNRVPQRPSRREIHVARARANFGRRTARVNDGVPPKPFAADARTSVPRPAPVGYFGPVACMAHAQASTTLAVRLGGGVVGRYCHD